MRSLTRKSIVGLALPLAISCSLIAGCGSSSKSSTTQKAATTSPPSTTASTTTKTTTYKIGKPAAVGTLRVQPTSLVRLGTANGPEGPGTELAYRLMVTVKNEGAQSATPFCAGEHASLNDVKGRVFEGEDLKPHESGSVNCVPLSAGLTGSPYLVDFHVPADTVPKTVSIWAEDTYKSQAQSWSAH